MAFMDVTERNPHFFKGIPGSYGLILHCFIETTLIVITIQWIMMVTIQVKVFWVVMSRPQL